jgi:hypothetical protein
VAGPSKEEGTEAGGISPEIELAAALVAYLRVAVSLIEGRRVSGEEILETIRRLWRQRSFARERRIDYVLRTLREDPP